ncbi:MAG: ComEC/Rec2 family competence protein, partial [Myxococcota bacterium]|nr:ComEC/Rec2 family competence protein [Myxococcota bacterium]
MAEPWAMWGAAVLLGAWIWPWFQPAPIPLLVALGGCVVLCVHGAAMSASRLMLPVSGLLLGLLAPATLPPPPAVDAPQRVVGVVVARSGAEVDLDADVGRLRVRLPSASPRVGTRLAAWVRPAPHRDRLPGEVDRRIAAMRARRTLAIARQWVRLGGRERTLDDPFRHTRHPGLLRALTGDGAGAAPAGAVSLLTRTGTRHLLAVSGLHIGLVAAAAAGASRFVAAPLAWLPWVWPSRVVPLLSGLLAAVAFASQAGWPTSSRRALLMYGVGSLAWMLGR